MGFPVYVLVSKSTSRRCTGQTESLEGRLGEHNGPWTVVFTQEVETRAGGRC